MDEYQYALCVTVMCASSPSQPHPTCKHLWLKHFTERKSMWQLCPVGKIQKGFSLLILDLL